MFFFFKITIDIEKYLCYSILELPWLSIHE
nr:MAG TPA: hypothetical protein [Caudoviricetes sp.]